MRKQFFCIFLLITATSSAQNSAVRQFSKTFADVAEKANPSVVTIMTEKTYETRSLHEWTPFEDFFSPKDTPKRKYKSRAIGAGVIVDDENGYILTNNHVIDEADEVEVKLMDKRVFSADIIGKAIKLVMGIVGAIALVMFVYAGGLWMVAGGNAEQTTKAMKTMVWSAIGLIVILSSYSIVNFIFTNTF